MGIESCSQFTKQGGPKVSGIDPICLNLTKLCQTQPSTIFIFLFFFQKKKLLAGCQFFKLLCLMIAAAEELFEFQTKEFIYAGGEWVEMLRRLCKRNN